MFKNVIVFRIGADWQPPANHELEQVLQTQRFAPCEPTQLESSGWVSPRPEDHSPLLETYKDNFILKLSVERKSVPGSAVRNELEKRCKALEEARGYKPGRKEKRALKEEITLEFLPRAFSKRSANLVWLDLKNRFLVVGTGSRRAADLVVDRLVGLMADAGAVITLAPLNTAQAPATAMSFWLENMEAPADFTVDRECELRQPDNERAVVRYSRHSLDIEEIAAHVRSGKIPTKLAMTWNGRVSFVLGDDLAIRKLEFLDGVFDDAEAGFDGDVAIATEELGGLFNAVVEALGGELEAQPAPDDQD